MKLKFDITEEIENNLNTLQKRLDLDLRQTVVLAFALLDMSTDPSVSKESIWKSIESLRK